jgi:hypothetical protein
MAQDPKTIVRWTQRPWSEEVRKADAMDMLETAGVPFPVETREKAYEFNGRTFVRGRENPYE